MITDKEKIADKLKTWAGKSELTIVTRFELPGAISAVSGQLACVMGIQFSVTAKNADGISIFTLENVHSLVEENFQVNLR
jgi:hypothetical protein